jgi:hypothetical protein
MNLATWNNFQISKNPFAHPPSSLDSMPCIVYNLHYLVINIFRIVVTNKVRIMNIHIFYLFTYFVLHILRDLIVSHISSRFSSSVAE